METGKLLPSTSLPVHRLVHGLQRVRRERLRGLPQRRPVHQRVDDAADGAGGLVRHVVLPARLRVLQSARERGSPASGVGGEVRLRAQDRRRRRPRVARVAADARVAQASFHGQDRPGQLADRQPVEARRLDPAGDRAEGPARHAAADGPLLLADRQRRQARAAAPGAAGRGGRRHPALAAARRAHLPVASAAVGRPQSDLSRGRAGRALAGDALQGRDLDERLRQLPDPDRRQDRHRAEGTRAPTSKTSPGGAATGRPRAIRRPSSSSAP